LAGVLRAIEDGMYSPALTERMRGLETRKIEFASALTAQPAAAPIALHPNLAELYRCTVEELEIALNDESTKAEAAVIVRSLIDMVVLTPEAEASRLVGERHCGLASILSLCENGGRKQRLLRIGESTVAGAGARGRDRHSLAASIQCSGRAAGGLVTT
jgi:site-specific DNA recombinase